MIKTFQKLSYFRLISAVYNEGSYIPKLSFIVEAKSPISTLSESLCWAIAQVESNTVCS